MPYYKFEEDDLFHNVIKTYPECVFFISHGKVYYNNKFLKSGNYSNLISHVPNGAISLYELNVDRNTDDDGAYVFIHPFISKDGSFSSFKTISSEEYNKDFLYGAKLTGSYPLSASISREYFAQGLPQNLQELDSLDGVEVSSQSDVVIDPQSGQKEPKTDIVKLQKKHILALKNTLNYYTYMSQHYIFSSSKDPFNPQFLRADDPLSYHAWDKAYQELGLIDIPSIFYGSSIKKGSVSLKFYTSGSLIAELQDRNRNGELIEVKTSNTSMATGSVAGVVLYKEGFIVLTGSWDLTSSTAPTHKEEYTAGSLSLPKWVYFGEGANDNSGSLVTGSSFQLAFSGTNHIPTVTMLAHAKRGELNHSNNPTYITYGQNTGSMTGSGEFGYYKEAENISIKNTISSSYGCDFTGSFKKQTFINKIGLYDENKNLIAVAKMATPVRKLETDEYTFKLKLDL